MDFGELLTDLGSGLLYGLVGIALLALGYYVMDLLTPGHLGRRLADDRNKNAGIVTASGLFAVGLIVVSAILASDGDLGEALADTAGFGIVGIILLGIAMMVIDVITPGKLGDSLMGDEHEPLVYVTAASLISVGGIVAAAIS